MCGTDSNHRDHQLLHILPPSSSLVVPPPPVRILLFSLGTLMLIIIDQKPCELLLWMGFMNNSTINLGNSWHPDTIQPCGLHETHLYFLRVKCTLKLPSSQTSTTESPDQHHSHLTVSTTQQHTQIPSHTYQLLWSYLSPHLL